MDNYIVTSKALGELEEISIKLDGLSALATVCGSAFISSDSFGNMHPREVHESFNNMSRQIKELSKDVQMVIKGFYEKEGAENDFRKSN